MQEELLKVAPQQQQVQYYSGTPVDVGVRLGTGLLLTIVANKVPLLAAGALCYPLWWPIYKAWWQNQKLRSQYRYLPIGACSCSAFHLKRHIKPNNVQPEQLGLRNAFLAIQDWARDGILTGRCQLCVHKPFVGSVTGSQVVVQWGEIQQLK